MYYRKYYCLSKIKKRKRKKDKYKSKKKKYYFIIKVITIITPLFIFYIFKKNNFFFSEKSSPFYNNNNYSKKYLNDTKTEIFDGYLSHIPSKYQNLFDEERKTIEKYLNLTDLSKEKDENKISEIKRKLLDSFLSLLNKKNSAEINYIYYTDINKFGNRIIILNNLIYYCEILGFKNIYLNSNIKWYIKDKIIGDTINITVVSSKSIDCNNAYIACFKSMTDPVFFFYYPKYIKPQIRLNLIKNEIKKNLPKVEINPNDLYIHIRSGDIFRSGYHPNYAQPPLCFYQNIFRSFKFRNIYIISENKNNPVINKLLRQFPNIIYKPNYLSYDIAYLSNSYNLVASVSSLLSVSVIFNDNLKNFFEYDIYKKSSKFIHLHHDFHNFPISFTIYKMEPSLKYKIEMFKFDNKVSQYKLMIKEKCINNFTIIKPNI